MSTSSVAGALAKRSTAVSAAILALLAYAPALAASPGRMPTDSKLYVYLNPGRFLADTTTTFDPRQFAGWVPHQHIAYLWPTGPWFWVFESLGVPDWIAHRLWIGTLLVLAGLGVRWMSRLVGLTPLAALAAALVYQLSPYVLPYISRTSVLLLPWAGLGWIVGLTVVAAVRGRWRHSAAIALVVLTVGAVNATALAMIIPAPALWLIHAAWQRTITWRRALATAGRVALLSAGVSLWWMAMLLIQGRRGADVLAYSESLESVSFTSTSTEVTRGLGYWLFYVRDSFAATTTASIDHLISVKTVFAGFALLVLCLAGLVATSWSNRRFAALLVGVGVVLAVGVHPIDDPSPLMSLLVGDGEGGLALALRSSTRAVPVLVLGLALGAGALVTAARQVSWRGADGRRLSIAMAAVVGLLAVANLPALRNGGFVDPALERDQDPPAAWLEAASQLDSLPNGYRVLQVPGAEFGAFQWGYTVDQPLPALTERPLLTRDLLPLGSPAAMDLLFALDDRVQDGTLDVDSVAPVARLLGVDTIWVSGDIQFDRFRLARPEIVDDLLTSDAAADADLLGPDRFGEPMVMAPRVEYIDEQSLADSRVGQPIAEVTLVAVADPIPTVRVKDDVVVLSGSGDGIVDAAAAGLIDGSELIRYSASLDDEALAAALDTASALIVTDSNRDRAHHWRSSQDVHGATESGGPGADVLRFEPADQRLPVFDTSDPDTQTIAVQDGPVRAAASAYGEPFAYLPEHRPVMAVDGDPQTSWLVADRAPAIGEFIRLEIPAGIDHLTLRQPDTAAGARSITEVSIRVGTGPDQVITLDGTSLSGDGQRIAISASDQPTSVTITIRATSDPQPPIAEAIGAVGFAEIGFGLPPTVEYIRAPVDASAATPPDTALSFVFNRLRADPQDRFRSDPEPTLRRQFESPNTRTFDATVTLRLPGDASGAVLSSAFGEPVAESGHLAGTPGARGASAFDGDTATSWITPFDDAVGSSVTLRSAGAATTIGLQQPGGDFSRITRVRVADPAGEADIDVPTGAEPSLPLPRPFDLAELTVTVIGVDERLTVDRRFGEPFGTPAAISEITFDGVSPAIAPVSSLRADCRTDLLELDGAAIGLSYDIASAAALSGAAIDAAVCDGPLTVGAGTHRLASTAGADSGLDVDTIVLTDVLTDVPAAVVADGSGADAVTTIDPTVIVLTDNSKRERTVEAPPCPSGCWVVLGEGFNDGWQASSASGSLGPPQLVDGNANGWWIEPTTTATTVTIRWTPQRTLTLALLASLLAAVASIALVVFDRRRDADRSAIHRAPCPSVPNVALRWTGLGGAPAMATVAAATIAAAVLIGWAWAIPAFAIAALGAARRSPRLVGLGGLLIVGGVALATTYIVAAERPFPNAGWPARFEWMHGWTLLGVVLLASATLFAADACAEADSNDARLDE